MKRTINQKRSFLKWYNQRGITCVISQSYIWFRDIYCAYVCDIEKANQKKDFTLLADCYYMIGDVHDFNECPKAAIKAYRKSFEIDSSCTGALRELGNMYCNIGQYKKAIYFLRKTLRIEPKDECAQSDYESALNDSKYKTPALYEEKDICWQAREMLAQYKPEKALKLLKGKRTIQARQIKANAFAMLNDMDSVLEQWQKITTSKGKIEMRFADWFYLDEFVWDSAKFWEIIAYCAKQKSFDYGVWPMFDSLDHVIPHPSKRIRKSSADLSRCARRIYLLAQYNIARLRNDYALANKLARKYPNWPEIQKLAVKIK